MGRAYIQQAAKKFEDAAHLFDKVENLLPDDIEEGLRAREESAWCKIQIGHVDNGIAVLQGVLDTLTTLQGRDEDCARCLWRLGTTYWNLGGQ